MSSALAASPRRTSAIGESRRSSQPLSTRLRARRRRRGGVLIACSSSPVPPAPAPAGCSGSRSSPTSFQPSGVAPEVRADRLLPCRMIGALGRDVDLRRSSRRADGRSRGRHRGRALRVSPIGVAGARGVVEPRPRGAVRRRRPRRSRRPRPRSRTSAAPAASRRGLTTGLTAVR